MLTVTVQAELSRHYWTITAAQARRLIELRHRVEPPGFMADTG